VSGLFETGSKVGIVFIHGFATSAKAPGHGIRRISSQCYCASDEFDIKSHN